MTDYDENAPQLPGPDPALKQLERFVGAWSLKGRTLDSDQDNVFGETTFECRHGDPGELGTRSGLVPTKSVHNEGDAS